MTSKDTRPGTTIWTPDSLRPEVVIPHHIAEAWALYGRIGYEKHNSEWGCAVRLQREGDTITVIDWRPYKIDASAAYWESIEGERQAHANELIEAGKEDELQEWNGLFHTHPIGSGATMSGTDREQLEDLARGGWWGVSIICPANREGVITPMKFQHHYAQDVLGVGMITVGNLKPTIVMPEEDTSELDRVITHMEELMVKIPKTTTVGSKKKTKVNGYKPMTGQYAKFNNSDVRSYLTGTRPECYKGDWVYIDRLDDSMWDPKVLTKSQVAELRSTVGKVGFVTDDTQQGQITVSFEHYGFEDTWILDPKMHGHAPGDDILLIASFGSHEADHVATIAQWMDPAMNYEVRQRIRAAGIEPPEFLSPAKQDYTKRLTTQH